MRERNPSDSLDQTTISRRGLLFGIGAVAGAAVGCSPGVETAREVSTPSTTATPEATGESSSTETSSTEKATSKAPDTPTPTAKKSSETTVVNEKQKVFEKPANAVSLSEAFQDKVANGPTEAELHDQYGLESQKDDYIREIAYRLYLTYAYAPFAPSQGVLDYGHCLPTELFGQNPTTRNLLEAAKRGEQDIAKDIFHSLYIPTALAVASGEGGKDVTYDEAKAGYPVDKALAKQIGTISGFPMVRGLYNVDNVHEKENVVVDTEATHQLLRSIVDTSTQVDNVSVLKIEESDFALGEFYTVTLGDETYEAVELKYRNISGEPRVAQVAFIPVTLNDDYPPAWPDRPTTHRDDYPNGIENIKMTGVEYVPNPYNIDKPQYTDDGQVVDRSGHKGPIMIPVFVAGQGVQFPVA